MLLSSLESALQELSRVLVRDVTVGEALTRMTELTKEVVPAAVAVGISMVDEKGNLATPIYTDVLSPEIDQAQYEEKLGPCLDAWRNERPVYVEEMANAVVDYPEFSRLSIKHGILSTLSLPLLVGSRSMGAVNLYARHAKAFSSADEAAVASLTAAGSIMLANASAYWEARTLGEHLGEAIKSRAIIEQAKGIVMAHRHDINADEAFDVLREISQRENVKLRDVAAAVIEKRSIPLRP